MDWRPLVGLTSDDEGTVAERVLANIVLERAVTLHNEDVRRASK